MLNLMQRNRIQVVQLAPPVPDGADEIGRLEHRQMLAHRLPRHLQVLAQLSEGLAVVLSKPIQQQSTARIRECPEDPVHLIVRHDPIMQVYTCIMSNAQVAPRAGLWVSVASASLRG